MEGTGNLAQRVVIVLLVITWVWGTESEGRTILVGDSQGWQAATNYTDWAIQNSPFRINDTLVFKYRGNSTMLGQSVYLLANKWNYITCQFKGAKMLGNASQGFKVQLNQFRPYYFASAEGNLYDCIAGLSKFTALPSKTTFN